MRYLSYCLLLVAVALLGHTAALPAADTPPAVPVAEQHQKARDLVRQLGARAFRARDRAAKELIALGAGALKALEEGAKDPDPEISKRCQELLPEIQQAGLRARLEAFRTDVEGKQAHDLPGWKLFSELVGKDREAREMFVGIFLTEMPMLEALEKEPARALGLCNERCQQIQNVLNGAGGQGPGLRPTELAPLFLVASHSTNVRGQFNHLYSLTNFLHQRGIRELLVDKAPSPFRKLVVAWMGRQTETQAFGHILSTASSLNLPEAGEFALKVVKEKKGGPNALGHALVMVAKSEGKKHLDLLEGFLEEKGSVSSFGIGNQLRGQTEVRDVALAMLVHLTDQKHIDYNFTFSRDNNQSWLLFNAPFLGFSEPKEREAAFKKWSEWKAKQKPKKG